MKDDLEKQSVMKYYLEEYFAGLQQKCLFLRFFTSGYFDFQFDLNKRYLQCYFNTLKKFIMFLLKQTFIQQF